MTETKPDTKATPKTAHPVTDTVTVESGAFNFGPAHRDEAEAEFRDRYSLPDSHPLKVIKVNHRVGYSFEVTLESAV